VVPSPFLGRAIRPLGFEAEMIPNIIDASKYTFRARSHPAPRLFWMRSFHEIYNPALAVRVFAAVKRDWPDATLVMAGPDRGQEPAVRALAADLGLQSAVRFAGFLDMPSKIAEFDAADIYLNTNRVDNTPVSVIEACASGVPIVATRVGGVSDLLTDGDTALLVREGDERSMTEAVKRLLVEPDLAGRLVSAGRRLAESCSAEVVMPHWHRLIDDVASRTRRAA
jgi:glycosyltransferase involved in cell wall biosynthesis